MSKTIRSALTIASKLAVLLAIALWISSIWLSISFIQESLHDFSGDDRFDDGWSVVVASFAGQLQIQGRRRLILTDGKRTATIHVHDFQGNTWQRLGFYRPHVSTTGDSIWIRCPYYLLAIPGVLIWSCAHVRKRKWRPGRCVSCGYDVRANVSGVCSECGAMVPADAPSTEAGIVD
ncbi:MAG: hypothetical protein H6816_14310 [Phycisphaerales bacterium]|nr:hypothetical protein [Phycisphaerales bacterium]